MLYDNSRLVAHNIIASYRPEARDRILLCAHWDSRPWADNDEDEANHHTPVMAANDGASGVAVMMEIARLLQQDSIEKFGIDFICFDAEDMGTPDWAETEREGNTWCLGSELWTRWAIANSYNARYGILFDMVGGYGSTFAMEQVSVAYAKPVVESLWQLAKQLGYSSYFPHKEGGAITDDHINVNSVGIPCIDIIPYFEDGPSSFGPTWHTVKDTPENIDPNVLKAVGQSVLQLIYNDR